VDPQLRGHRGAIRNYVDLAGLKEAFGDGQNAYRMLERLEYALDDVLGELETDSTLVARMGADGEGDPVILSLGATHGLVLVTADHSSVVTERLLGPDPGPIVLTVTRPIAADYVQDSFYRLSLDVPEFGEIVLDADDADELKSMQEAIISAFTG
jgi:hypothetical protein